ncbi:MAG: hypothetical protein A3A80_01350 [Candidatus Terrybacteria bacterium RIFCSPLOWO2_01_FULL_44_24]|uniref:Baseplate protein J-like domain-containing protein n=1 Tax=Candidatus Terrybacteria bacterium RIFCSPHIGHO2_01_FULL_43_35 TaxID=1802361 RepID=A0A1G2PFK5_9BACT|nr:MAG: hypothetical protein A2828_03725 [Candidatus Terrybacteria bacterium RIFCSPHIGHO2_01_FULL_43_35]OHA49950.1 MAG: hypothetical protein A3B75_03575 [Candidatus Terrybacteria bacterium RIFCSPHIGHO2_02_FULL_43_14]OHA51728.1 MAG: hypothetical protein A3A80_01350 [Candidatus Terrybacteria bacterium RIFCSPLOWO2_01_FULL_44_24]
MITINVLPEEELLSVIDKIVTSQQPDIRLIIPNGARILESVENFSLIKREAEGAGKVVSVATADPRARSFAQSVGLAVFAVPLSYQDENLNAAAFRPSMSDILPPSFSVHSVVPRAGQVKPIANISSVHPAEEPKERQVDKNKDRNFITEESRDIIDPLLFPESGHEFTDTNDKKELSQRDKNIFISVIKKFGSWPFLITISGGLAAVIVAYALFLSPRAELTIIPRTDDFSSDFSFVVATDPGSDDISGQMVEIQKEASAEISSSGTATVEDKAHGTVKIFNAYSSSQQTLVETTRLVSQDGKLFRTAATVVIPGATIDNGEIIPSSIDVPIIANEAGPEYNIGPSTFSIPGFQGTPKYTKFFGRSSEAMVGGAKGTVKVVSDTDVKKAEDAASKDALAQAEEEFAQKIPDGFKLLDSARFLNQETLSNAASGDKMDSIRSISKVRIRAMLFREDDIYSMINVLLEKQFTAQVEPVAGSIKIDYSVPTLELDKGRMKLEVKVDERVAWKVDIADIKNEIAGKSEEEIKQIIGARSDIASGKATFRPAWVDKAPSDVSRITIKLILDANTSSE